jgi:hypothetical protein
MRLIAVRSFSNYAFFAFFAVTVLAEKLLTET